MALSFRNSTLTSLKGLLLMALKGAFNVDFRFEESRFRVLDPKGPFGARSVARLGQILTDKHFRD